MTLTNANPPTPSEADLKAAEDFASIKYDKYSGSYVTQEWSAEFDAFLAGIAYERATLLPLLERAKIAVHMANVVDCSPCPENSPAPIEECEEHKWQRFASELLADIEKVLGKPAENQK